MAGSDLPAVLANIQRAGPGLGGIQPSQSDYFLTTRSSGHGDFRMLSLAPCNVQEMFDFTYLAFDLADKYRITCMVLADGLLGQMMEPADISPKEVMPMPPKDWALTGTQMKRRHNIINSLYLEPEELNGINAERYKKYKAIEENEARCETYLTDDAEIAVAAYGASARIARLVVDELRREGIKAGLIRPITLWPFPKEAFFSLAKTVKVFLVVEMSMGQMIEDVELAIRCSKPVSFYGRVGGVVPQPGEIIKKAKEALNV